MREQAAELGAGTEVCYLHVPREVLWAHLSARNADLPPYTFHVSKDQLDLWSSWFERPTPGELAWAHEG